MKIKNLSVFFPAFNEEENIKNTIAKTVSFLDKKKINYEILVIDDGSSDNTSGVVKDLSKENRKIKLIRHRKNRGYGGALKTGMKSASYEWICFTDSDGQFDFSELDLFLPYIKDYDLIVGHRKKRQDSIKRRAFAKLLQWGDFILFGVWLKDIDCGFKLFRGEVVKKIWPLTTESAITETEFIVRAKRAGFKIKEVGINHFARTEGVQTGGQVKIIVRAMKEALILFYQLNIKK